MPAHAAHPELPDTAEQVLVRTKRVSCDGVGGALGHPRVYLEMGEDNKVECPPACTRARADIKARSSPANEAGKAGVGRAGDPSLLSPRESPRAPSRNRRLRAVAD